MPSEQAIPGSVAPTDGGRCPALELRGVSAGYGDTIVLRDIDLVVRTGRVVALLGPNGAGKSTLLRAAAGLLRAGAGTIAVAGRDVGHEPIHHVARDGVCLIPEGRGVFPSLSVRENVRLFAPETDRDSALERVVEFFPALAHHIGQRAGSLSGGEQQMLAMSRAVVSDPIVVLVDEASMGLSPIVVDQVFNFLGALAARGTALLVVEQYVHRVLAIADDAYLLNHGEIAFSGPAEAVQQDDLFRRYAGLS
jgi:branched-chain amino acid transport system ATP-binding protein